ncbi:MAG: HAMP domain-containing protein [Actinobacteria bacterium]|nr:HAMP domain-containing protein [Actinomycetota bacterium]
MKHPLRRVSLQAWLVAAFIAVGAIASLVVLVLLLPRLEANVTRDRARQVVIEARAAVAEQLALVGRRGGLTDLVRGSEAASTFAAKVLRTLPDQGEVRVFGASPLGLIILADVSNAGAAVFGAEPSEPARRVASSTVNRTEWRFTVIAGRRIVIVAQPIWEQQSTIGVVEAAQLVPGLSGDIASLRARVFLSTVSVLALASLLGALLARLLARRIAGLARTASTLAGGDLSARAPDTSPRELAVLSDGLNRMATRLQGLVTDATGERDRINDLILSLEEGVVAVRPNGEISVTNPAAARYLGPKAGDAGMHLDDLPVAFAQTVRRSLAADIAAEPQSAEVTLESGRVLLVAVAPLPRATGVVATLRDVTMERRLERARRELIANVSHELRTPLTALKGFLELLEDEAMSAERRSEFIGHMSTETARLERLVVEQLELARLDAGALPLEESVVDLGELAEGIVEARHLLFARRGVSLTCRLERPSHLSALVDPARVEQILLILLDNALRHTPPRGSVEVRVGQRAPDSVFLAVVDTGEGIHPESVPFVFDRFYRADPSREGRGAGLGLAIARGLAEAHGGGIDVESVPGSGSTFTVRLPGLPSETPSVLVGPPRE